MIKRSLVGKSNKGRRVLTTRDENPAKNVLPVQGCRVVDFQHMANQMICSACKTPLLIKNIVRERVEGLGSHLYIRCTHCSKVANVTTGEQYKILDKDKRPAFVINTKSALGKILSIIDVSK